MKHSDRWIHPFADIAALDESPAEISLIDNWRFCFSHYCQWTDKWFDYSLEERRSDNCIFCKRLIIPNRHKVLSCLTWHCLRRVRMILGNLKKNEKCFSIDLIEKTHTVLNENKHLPCSAYNRLMVIWWWHWNAFSSLEAKKAVDMDE